jgi:hypothetical protein
MRPLRQDHPQDHGRGHRGRRRELWRLPPAGLIHTELKLPETRWMPRQLDLAATIIPA